MLVSIFTGLVAGAAIIHLTTEVIGRVWDAVKEEAVGADAPTFAQDPQSETEFNLVEEAFFASSPEVNQISSDEEMETIWEGCALPIQENGAWARLLEVSMGFGPFLEVGIETGFYVPQNPWTLSGPQPRGDYLPRPLRGRLMELHELNLV